MSWAQPNATEWGWRDDADLVASYELLTADGLGVDSLGAVVANVRSSKIDKETGEARWRHVASFAVTSIALPVGSIRFAVGAGPDALRYENMRHEVRNRVRPVSLACGGTEASILDAIVGSDTSLDPTTDQDYLVRLSETIHKWLSVGPLSRRPKIVHPSLMGRIEYTPPDFLAMVRLIKTIDGEDGVLERRNQLPPIVIRASKRSPVGSMNVSGMKGAFRQGRSKEWGNIECPDLMVPLAELQIPNDAALQKFRDLFAKSGCTDYELLAFISTVAQPTQAVGGNDLVKLTEWAQCGVEIRPTLADAARASVIQYYLKMPLAKRMIQLGADGRVNYYGMSMVTSYQPPVKIEPFLARMAATLGVRRKPKA